MAHVGVIEDKIVAVDGSLEPGLAGNGPDIHLAGQVAVKLHIVKGHKVEYALQPYAVKRDGERVVGRRGYAAGEREGIVAGADVEIIDAHLAVLVAQCARGDMTQGVAGKEARGMYDRHNVLAR